jgi:hypothetical protein
VPANQLEFAGFIAPAPSRVGALPAVAPKPRRILVIDDDSTPKRKRKRPEPTPEQQRKRHAREKRSRDRRDAQWVSCCTYSYNRSRACHTWWTTCRSCGQPLRWPAW